jgi:hypothetical protein
MTISQVQRIANGFTIDKSGCWLWQRATDKDGYGITSVNRVTHRAHRLVYLLANGKLDNKLTIDHLCEVKECVNPSHLEQVATGVNTLRSSKAPAAINARKTHCKQGHELTPDNTYRNSGGRMCKICSSLKNKADYKRRVTQ